MSDKRTRCTAWLSGSGIEIGGLHRPLRLPPGVGIRYVDRYGEEDLRRHYPELAGAPLVPVSILGTADHLETIADSSVDFVVANHVLEHIEFPVRALMEFQRVLRPGGVLFMALPDARFTFDANRPRTTVAHLIDEHRRGTSEFRGAHFLEWAEFVLGETDQAERIAKDLMVNDYAIHYHVWEVDTFLEFLFAARTEAGLDFHIAAVEPPRGGRDDEFIVVLARACQDAAPVPAYGGRYFRWLTWRSASWIGDMVARSAAGPLSRAVYRRLKHRSRQGRL